MINKFKIPSKKNYNNEVIKKKKNSNNVNQ